MTTEPHNLILDYLRELRAGQNRLENTLKDIQAQLHAMRHNQIAFSSDNLRHDERLSEIEVRLEKIEKAAEFIDTP